MGWKGENIDIENMDKIEMIRTIQQAQGTEPCFGTAECYPSRADCCFLEDCLQVSK